jgi:ribosomal protein S18 acetylase RimI-like enzyme
MSSRGSAESAPALVRGARVDDGEALQHLDAATCTSDVSPAPPPDPGGDFFGDGVRPADVLVAESDGEVVGYVRLAPRYDRLPAGRHVHQIRGLAVSPHSQGNGIGRQLVLEAAEVARRRGARRLTLNVLATNHVAQRLYERCGFVVEGVHRDEFYLCGRYVDDLALALDLE